MEAYAGCLIVLLAPVFIWWLVTYDSRHGLRYTPPATSAPQPTNVAPAGASTIGYHQIAGDGHFGCADADYLDKVMTYAAQGDREAFRQALATGVAEGGCTFFKAGESVYLMDTKVLSAMVKVRRGGETAEYWMDATWVR